MSKRHAPTWWRKRTAVAKQELAEREEKEREEHEREAAERVQLEQSLSQPATLTG